MCDICQVDGILSKYFGRETARTMPIERTVDEENELVGYRVGFGGYWVCEETAETLNAAMPKVETWALDFAKKILSIELEADPIPNGVEGKLGLVSFQMQHDGKGWLCEIGGKPFELHEPRINKWIEEVKAALEETTKSYN